MKIVTGIAIIFISCSLFAHDFKSHFLHEHNFGSQPIFMENEGLFVEIPSYCGGGIFGFAGFAVGLGVGIAYLPVKLPFMIFNRGHVPVLSPIWDSIFDDYSATCAGTDIGYRVGQYVLGSPFYGIKKVFWDGPVYLWNTIFGNNKEINFNKIDPLNSDSAAASSE